MKEHDRLRTILRGLTRGLLGARLPAHTGRVRLDGAGPHEAVTIGRDDFGVPYIDARSDHDAWFGLGFCHGQDRAGQLELLLRVVRGTLAEVAGPDVLPIDQLARRVGFRRAAADQLARAPAVVQEQLDVYARGLNAGVWRGARRRAHEFTLLRCQPTPWDAQDVQALFAFLCFTLASNWDIELVRLKILERDGPAALTELDPAYPRHLPVSAPSGALAAGELDLLARDLLLFERTFALRGGSNAWVVDGSRSASGRPLLANDPHMPPAIPPLWYLAHVRTPTWSACGASFIGTPGFGCGHNGRAAWGVTAAHADNTDLFIEELLEENIEGSIEEGSVEGNVEGNVERKIEGNVEGNIAGSVERGGGGVSARGPGGFTPCERVVERIRVRGRPDVVETVVITPRGPIVSGAAMPDAPTGAGLAGGAGRRTRRALSLAATWLAARPYVGLMRAHTARSFHDFRELFRVSAQASASLVYADTRGHIGWTLAVELPRRRAGHGLLPMPAWGEGVGWADEIVPFDAIPHERDSPAGFYAAANNQPVPDASGEPFLGVDWLDGYRQARIVERLRARDDWSVASMQRLQLDLVSGPWKELRALILDTAPPGDADAPDAALGRALLRAWDGRVRADAPGAAVYCLLMAALCRAVVTARAPGAARWALGAGFTGLLPHNLMVTRRLGHLVALLRARPDDVAKGPGPSSDLPGGGWSRALSDALTEVVQELRRDLGPDPARWSWGRARPVALEHLLGQQPPLDRLFNVGPCSFGGDSSTIAQGVYDPSAPRANAVAIPVLRAVIDVGNWDASRFSLAGGQSGNPFSRNYDDLLRHHDLGGVPIAWSRAAIRRRVTRTLTLEP